ncbi:MAG: PfkB family carbohydrate kinase [Candidatus Eisenbacteria bacterium]|nr:PfkB family carbohydrate kinase [Candidatus Eisenbacteria bacterium]
MMQPDLRETIASFSSLRALVLGEAILDGYLDGEATRICREAPVPILDVDPPRHFPGGAANTAANLRRLGARVRFLSAAGNDADGAILQGLLGQAGVECSGMLVHPGRRTLAKNRLFAGSQMLVRFDSGTTRPIDPQTEEALLGVLESAWAEADLLVVSDYGYGVLTSAVVERLRLLQARRPLVLAVDSK